MQPMKSLLEGRRAARDWRRRPDEPVPQHHGRDDASGESEGGVDARAGGDGVHVGSGVRGISGKGEGPAAAGMLADLAVLSVDVFTAPSTRVAEGIASVLTMLGGRSFTKREPCVTLRLAIMLGEPRMTAEGRSSAISDPSSIRLRRDRELVEISAPGRCQSRSRRDPSPRDRRRRAGAAVHQRARRATFRSSPTCSAPRAAPSWRSARGRSRSIKRLVQLAETLLPPTPAKLWGARDVGRRAAQGRHAARRGTGPVVEVVTSDVRLDQLPVLTCWPEDGGPFVTLPLVYTEHPGQAGPQPRHVPDAGATTRARPACTGRSARAAASTTRAAEARGEALPVTVFLGGPPALILSAIAPLPGERARADAGVAHRRRAAAAGRRGRRHPHPLVAERGVRADGRGPRRSVRRPEGPFGDHYGYYSLQHDYPVFDVQADRASQGRDLSRRPSSASRARRTSSSATCCRSCCRRCSRW